MITRVPVYVAHPLNAPTAAERDANRARASRWVAWLAERYLVAPVADWILLAGQWPETADWRAVGLAIDRVLVELCGTIVLCGPRVSPGMQFEAGWAKTIIDLTGPWTIDCEFGFSTQTFDGGLTEPRNPDDARAEIDVRMAAGGIERAVRGG